MTVPGAGRSENILERREGRSLLGTAWRPFPTWNLERPEGRSLLGTWNLELGTAWRPFPTWNGVKAVPYRAEGVPYRAEGPFPTELSGNGPGAVPGPNRPAID